LWLSAAVSQLREPVERRDDMKHHYFFSNFMTV
jgi:hypothetical protein